MSHKKQGFRALGVSLLALFGLMAFIAGGAQATPGAMWLILGTTFAGSRQVAAELHSTTALLLVGGTWNITFHCTTVKSEDLLIFGEGESTGKLSFSGCTASQGGVALPICNPTNQPIVADFKALLILHNSETYILFSPLIGQTVLAPFLFSEECNLPLAKNVYVTGSLVAECGHLNAGAFVHLDCSREETSHLLRQAPAALFPSDALLFGSKPASLDGIGKVFLATEPTENWGGLG